MKVFLGFPPQRAAARTAVAIGNFDGVHRGHQVLLRGAADFAVSHPGVTACALTFEPHPKEFFCPDSAPARISTLRDKIALFSRYGSEMACVARFTRALADMTPEQFVSGILGARLHAAFVAVGSNFTFGRRGSGTAGDLRRLCEPLGIEVFAPEVLREDGGCVSSSRLRGLLAAGDLEEAERLMGHPCTITGRVGHGEEMGRKLGFPTLNLRPLPPGCRSRPAAEGVFASWVCGLADRPLPGITSIGCRPTLGERLRYTCETNVLGWRGNAYGRMIQVRLVRKLRDNRKFSGLEELRAGIRGDEAAARAFFSETQGGPGRAFEERPSNT
ncbi:bifunctional riboflavin kinase/FAD synthetase [Mesosutterella sp. AGMB02718]|uniref:Riboflavin biosynthesis protein n=1 Tax=Mesosutterella faecium TaxID=2925194 RepID=A0ABT7IMF2_9BURK|nr:bifunctional riboflavin kinase/FAD synthetase [Mesosutterella sp. AGMB02718]MDL2058502.1 bifunctional riboflavin kinase/FAD synthetase [Mesosutterella sp. AGMB02718]